MEDANIIRLLWDRAERAIEALAQRVGKQLYHTAMNILNDHMDAQECVSDTYFAVWNAIPPRCPEPLAPFVLRIGKNLSLNRLRSRATQRRAGNYELSLEELARCIGGPTLEETMDERELGRAIDRYLDTLSRENRILFLRRYWFGDSIKDLAAVFGLKENAVSVRLSRLRVKLKDYLIKEELYRE